MWLDFALPCRGRVASAASPGGGPSLREIGACGTAPPRHACASLRRASLPLAGEGEGNSQRCAARIFAKRRRVRLPSHLARRPRRNPRARGTPGSRGTHGPWHLAAPRRPGREPGLPALEALRKLPAGPGNFTESCHRKSAVSPASRARCLIGLLRMTPGGLTFQAPSPFPIARGPAPTHRLRSRPMRPRNDGANASAVISRGARRARRDHAAWAAVADAACVCHGHRTNRPGCLRSDPEACAGASPPPPLRPSPRFERLERALGWDGASVHIFL